MNIIQNKWITAFIIAIALFSNACTEQEDSNKNALSKSELAKHINDLSDSIAVPMDAAMAKKLSLELLRSCTEFADNFPEDERCADYLFIASRAAGGLGQYNKSLSILDRIKKGYNGYAKMPEVYFLYAFTLDEDLDQKEKAKEAYMELINKFPGDPLSIQSALLMDQLYLSDEELIEKWKNQEENQ
jgi:tetratricopeptide (TPR) repeat protein